MRSLGHVGDRIHQWRQNRAVLRVAQLLEGTLCQLDVGAFVDRRLFLEIHDQRADQPRRRHQPDKSSRGQETYPDILRGRKATLVGFLKLCFRETEKPECACRHDSNLRCWIVQRRHQRSPRGGGLHVIVPKRAGRRGADARVRILQRADDQRSGRQLAPGGKILDGVDSLLNVPALEIVGRVFDNALRVSVQRLGDDEGRHEAEQEHDQAATHQRHELPESTCFQLYCLEFRAR